MLPSKHHALICAAATLAIPACLHAPDDAAPPDPTAEVEMELSSDGAVCAAAAITQDAVIWQAAPGWNDGVGEKLSTGTSASGGVRRTLLQADLSALPAGATVVSASLSLYQLYKSGPDTTVNVHEVTAPWSETAVTWGNFADAFAPGVAGSFTSSASIGFRTAQITDLVQSWADGAQNHGLLLDELTSSSSTSYRSRESTGANERPSLSICYVTCEDGIQNGSETGVDCGGSCAPCPTCDDGAQNGSETGVDCGGSCAPCPTCDDGAQNGSETGVDCGGSCAPCPTCDDGIQNGSETGVDCGGSCAPCPTCDDGIQNGSETGVDCGGSCGSCTPPPVCGNGVREAGEECDGSDMGGKSCTVGVLLCSSSCKYILKLCVSL